MRMNEDRRGVEFDRALKHLGVELRRPRQHRAIGEALKRLRRNGHELAGKKVVALRTAADRAEEKAGLFALTEMLYVRPNVQHQLGGNSQVERAPCARGRIGGSGL